MKTMKILQNTMYRLLTLARWIGQKLSRSVVFRLLCGQLCGTLCILVIPGLLCLALLDSLSAPQLVLALASSLTLAVCLGRWSHDGPTSMERTQMLVSGTVWMLNLGACLWLHIRGTYLYGCLALLLLIATPKLLNGSTASQSTSQTESRDAHRDRSRRSAPVLDVIDPDFPSFNF